MVYSIAAMLNQAQSTETEAMLDAMAGLELSTPFGRIRWREIDHQATMGAYVGRTAIEDGLPTMVDWYYADGADYLPPDDEVRQMRPQS